MTTTGKRVRGSGSLFRKGTSRTWTLQYYREGYKEDKEGNLILDCSGNPTRARVRVREATGLSSERQAQNLLTERLSQVSRGEWHERQRQPVTIENLFLALKENYLANRRQSAESLGRRWKHLRPAFAGVTAANLTTDAVVRYTLHRQKQGAAIATINRELATLRRALNLGRQSTPPKVRVVPYIPLLKEDNTRQGFVEDAGFELLAAEASELWMRTFLELAFTYGWRKGELLGVRVRQVNLTKRTIRLDPGTTKNREGREVAMTARAEELLRAAVAGKTADAYVLTREDGTRVKDFRTAWRNLCVRAGLGEWLCRGCKEVMPERRCKCDCREERRYRGLIVHDLRRSAAKALRAAGVPESVIMATGGWKTPAVFRRYAIVSSADNRAAVEALERERASINKAAAVVADSAGTDQLRPN